MLLTQAEIARRLNVSPESVRLWRKAGSFPEPESDAPGKRPRWRAEALAQFWRQHNAWREEAPEPEADTVALSPLAALCFSERRLSRDLYERALALAELLSEDSPRGGQGGMLERAWAYQTVASERDRLHQDSVVSISKPAHGAPDHAAKLAKAKRRAAVERQYSDQELTLLRAVLVDEESFDKAGACVGMSAEAAKATVVDCVKRLAERT
ncbi:MAG: helix-turn-helix transcriptional regulator [Methylocystis sp.]